MTLALVVATLHHHRHRLLGVGLPPAGPALCAAMAMHRRAGQEDAYQDDAHAYYDDDHSKEKRGLLSALDPFFGRMMSNSPMMFFISDTLSTISSGFLRL